MQSLDHILKAHVVSPDAAEPLDGQLLAAAFVVVTEKGIVYANAAGRLGFDSGSPAYTTDSVSWIASMTKLVTATCMLQLVEKGLVGLDDDVRPRVPELAGMQVLRGFTEGGAPVLEANTRPITLRHLLTHTLGLGYDLADPELRKWSAAVGRTANNLQWSLAGFTTPLKFAPGDGWCYGAAYDWAGHLLTVLTGRRLSDYMQENVFTPLGMRSTTFWPGRAPGDYSDRMLDFAVVAGGNNDDADSAPALKPGPSPVPEEHEMESGGSGLYSTPSDFARFLGAVLTNKLLKKETTDAMLAPQLDVRQQKMLASITDAHHDAFIPEFPRGTALDHGLAGLINVEDVQGKRRGGSLTWSGMTNGRWWIDRKTGIAAAMLTQVLPHGNRTVARMWDELERAVYRDLAGA